MSWAAALPAPAPWGPTALAQRHAARNPVWPYEWRVHYRDGGTLARLQARRGTASVELLRDVRRLEVWGPTTFAVEARGPVPVSAVVVRAQVETAMLPGQAERVTIRCAFGLAQGDGWHGVVCDLRGRAVTVAGPAP